MKLFIYKLLVSLVAIYILFQLTIGLMLKDFEKKIIQIKSQENIELIKSKIREELTNGVDKDSILSAEDAKLIRDFFKKISSEINSN